MILRFKKLILILNSLAIVSLCFCQNFDIDLLRSVNLERNQQLDPMMKLLSESATPVTVTVPITTFAYGWLAHNKNIQLKGIKMAVAVIGASLLTTSIKYAIKRDRPFITYPDIIKLDNAGSPSFPSGHTSTAFSTATALSISFPKWYVIVPSYLWAGSVGYSRMHLGVHYPSDVIAGAIIGSGTAYISHYLLKRWHQKPKNKDKTFCQLKLNDTF